MEYVPDRWVVIKITPAEGDPHYRVFASFYGGYLNGDSWKMNSGITSVEETEKDYLFSGSSGSCYRCSKDAYGMSSYSASILNQLIKENAGIISGELPETTNWMELDYGKSRTKRL